MSWVERTVSNLPALYRFATENGEESLKANGLQYCRDNRKALTQNLPWEELSDIPEEIGHILFPAPVASSTDAW